MSAPRILHISADFPDPIVPMKTQVFERLAGLVDGSFDQHVLSLNRRATLLPASGPAANIVVERRPFQLGTAFVYEAPSNGLWLHGQLIRLADALIDLTVHDPRPDLIVAHKLTIEGLVAERIATRLGVPYAIVIQGNTDTKIAGLRPDLRAHYRRILEGASQVFCFAPWAWAKLEEQLGEISARPSWLPAPTDLDRPLAPTKGDGSLVSAFHLDAWRTKGLSSLARALAQLGGRAPPVAIFGGGTDTAVSRCKRLLSLAPSARLEGHADREELPGHFNQADGFFLPSKRESFGLVFIEALFAGLPVIYPKGAAIDGYFDEFPFAIAVDARNTASLAKAIVYLMENEARLKAELKDWQASDHASQFQRPSIGRAFSTGLMSALA